jgi:hypothetical protein
MLSNVKVLGGVLVFGLIAATNMPANHTHTQMDPGITHFKAFFATCAAWLNFSNLI